MASQRYNFLDDWGSTTRAEPIVLTLRSANRPSITVRGVLEGDEVRFLLPPGTRLPPLPPLLPSFPPPATVPPVLPPVQIPVNHTSQAPPSPSPSNPSPAGRVPPRRSDTPVPDSWEDEVDLDDAPTAPNVPVFRPAGNLINVRGDLVGRVIARRIVELWGNGHPIQNITNLRAMANELREEFDQRVTLRVIQNHLQAQGLLTHRANVENDEPKPPGRRRPRRRPRCPPIGEDYVPHELFRDAPDFEAQTRRIQIVRVEDFEDFEDLEDVEDFEDVDDLDDLAD